MNFSPFVKSWLILACIVISTGTTAGMTAFLSGSSPSIAFLIGLGTAASNVLMNLMKSPQDKATKSTNNPVS